MNDLLLFPHFIETEETELLLSLVLAQSPHLSVIYFKHINAKGLRLIASECAPSLEIIETEVDYNALEAIQSICRTCPNLTVLRVENFLNDLSPDELILTAVQCCPMIQVLPTLHLELTDAAVNALASENSLTELILNEYHPNSSDVIKRVIESNPHLPCIGLDGDYIDAELVSCIAGSCGNLQILELMKEPFADPDSADISVLFSSALINLFRGCTHLEEFTLHQASGLTSEALRALLQYCPNLRVLDLFINSTIKGSLVDEPVLDAPFPSLTILSVEGNGVAESALRDIFTYCISLSEVRLRKCNQVTDETIQIIVQHCASLAALKQWFCAYVTIAGILEATHFFALTLLTLVFMPASDEVLIQLSLYCRSLIRLSLFSCDGLVY